MKIEELFSLQKPKSLRFIKEYLINDSLLSTRKTEFFEEERSEFFDQAFTNFSRSFEILKRYFNSPFFKLGHFAVVSLLSSDYYFDMPYKELRKRLGKKFISLEEFSEQKIFSLMQREINKRYKYAIKEEKTLNVFFLSFAKLKTNKATISQDLRIEVSFEFNVLF
ncbi:hypothetical protein YS40_127 [Thermus phage phiYS40]|uniref:hypothetical protein n=1 Tax=Thermus phage phiYS40 TaxID=407392 RepID=UPI0000E689F5|nr:hypothetical protein YS40_127 [Thermus phage phiYS40]ABJ91521.1 hypothetical protein YS40_127 [Thermus phage phiYS40]BAK53645.1 hypothetical protein YSP_127 [Thermus phage phiYS40]